MGYWLVEVFADLYYMWRERLRYEMSEYFYHLPCSSGYVLQISFCGCVSESWSTSMWLSCTRMLLWSREVQSISRYVVFRTFSWNVCVCPFACRIHCPFPRCSMLPVLNLNIFLGRPVYRFQPVLSSTK